MPGGGHCVKPESEIYDYALVNKTLEYLDYAANQSKPFFIMTGFRCVEQEEEVEEDKEKGEEKNWKKSNRPRVKLPLGIFLHIGFRKCNAINFHSYL